MLAYFNELVHPIRYHLLTAAFVAGFIVDNLTLNRVDQIFDNAVLLFYIALAMLSIMYLYLGISGRISERAELHAAKWAPYAMQYAFGGLMSGMLVFYGRSGTWYSSWPYLLLLVGIILGNEFIKRRAQRLIFNLSVLFIGLFSYLVLTVPILAGKMGALVFVGSGALALITFSLFARALYMVVPNFMALNTRSIFFSIGMIYFVLNVLYFTNLIPPIPLSQKDIGIYHSVERLQDGGYRFAYEEGKWYQFLRDSDTTFHYRAGDRIYCYAAVFAPTRLSATIYHRWEKYDEDKGVWREHDRLSYSIDGGRAGGYRGYTYIETVEDGKWRCTVETERAQIIGRETFIVDTAEPPAPLQTRVDM